MNYKALMSDIDGTLVRYEYEALPSDVIVEAIKKAIKHVTVCLVTGRSYAHTEKVLERLSLESGYVVLNNGAQVLELPSKKLLYEQQITVADAKEIVELFHTEGIPFFLKQEVFGMTYIREHFKKEQEITTPYMFFTAAQYSSKRIDNLLQKLSHLQEITVHKGHHNDQTKFGLSISHVNATKLHGIHVVMEKLHLKKEEIIGVGDSYNDFPLLMASGLKVAMGNAIADLKAIADYVAPNVTDDGVAAVIEKFILVS